MGKSTIADIYGNTLFDEENAGTQMQDIYESFDRNGSIEDDLHENHLVMGAPKFEVTEKIDALLRESLSEDENIIVRRYFGLGCQPMTVEELAGSSRTSVPSMERILQEALQHIREHDKVLDLWQYLYR